MGMDVYGIAPKNKCGEYFGLGASAWRPLATHLGEIAPEITCKCKYWYCNDCDGLDGESSRLLADILQKEIESGRADEFTRLWQSECGPTPNPFSQHERTGTWAAERLQEFAYFLRYCGGFEICLRGAGKGLAA